MKRQNVPYPRAKKALDQLGENLRLARKRRKITAQMMSERANLSLMTLRLIERGSPNVSMCNYMAIIACLGFQDDLAKDGKIALMVANVADAEKSFAVSGLSAAAVACLDGCNTFASADVRSARPSAAVDSLAGGRALTDFCFGRRESLL